MTEGNLRTIHVFPSQDSYETNQGSIGADDLALIPVDILPTGTIIPFAGSDIPSGYLPCNGSAISRTTYADLFAVIGTTYGDGDGSTTFNLPNLNNNSFLEGSNTTGTVKSAGLPNITGNVIGLFSTSTQQSANGAIRFDQKGNFFSDSTPTYVNSSISFNASRSSSIYGNSTTVQPKSVTVKFCIKY